MSSCTNVLITSVMLLSALISKVMTSRPSSANFDFAEPADPSLVSRAGVPKNLTGLLVGILNTISALSKRSGYNLSSSLCPTKSLSLIAITSCGYCSNLGWGSALLYLINPC